VTLIFLALRFRLRSLFAFTDGAWSSFLIGATLGIGLVIILFLFQNWWLAIQVAMAAIFMQQINLLAPRLMGNFTGLNPIWIFIALLMGAQIAGF